MIGKGKMRKENVTSGTVVGVAMNEASVGEVPENVYGAVAGEISESADGVVAGDVAEDEEPEEEVLAGKTKSSRENMNEECETVELG